DHQIFDYWKRFYAKRFDRNRFTVPKFAHVKLAGRARVVGTVRFAIDRQTAGTANSFAAIGIERDRIFSAQQQTLIYDIEHFEKRSLSGDIRRIAFDEFTVRFRVRLTP